MGGGGGVTMVSFLKNWASTKNINDKMSSYKNIFRFFKAEIKDNQDVVLPL